MRRRSVLLGLAVLTAVPAHAADPAGKTVEVGKVFPYLAAYLKLPAAERDRFRLAYFATRDGKPAAGLSGWIDDGGRRVPVAFGAEGRAERLPTLAQLQAKRAFGLDVPASTKMGMTLVLEPALRPAAELPAGELAAALAQATRGAKKAAGPLGLAMPKLDAVRLLGAEGGEVVFADGRTAPLPVEKGAPVFKPAAHPGAWILRFRTPPRRMMLT